MVPARVGRKGGSVKSPTVRRVVFDTVAANPELTAQQIVPLSGLDQRKVWSALGRLHSIGMIQLDQLGRYGRWTVVPGHPGPPGIESGPHKPTGRPTTRRRVWACIQANPGITAARIEELTGITIKQIHSATSGMTEEMMIRIVERSPTRWECVPGREGPKGGNGGRKPRVAVGTLFRVPPCELELVMPWVDCRPERVRCAA